MCVDKGASPTLDRLCQHLFVLRKVWVILTRLEVEIHKRNSATKQCQPFGLQLILNTPNCTETYTTWLSRERDNFRFSTKWNKKGQVAVSGNILFPLRALNNSMAGLNTKSTGSRSGSRKDSLEKSNQGESLQSNREFIQLLRKLPDEVARLQGKLYMLKSEAKASPSR